MLLKIDFRVLHRVGERGKDVPVMLSVVKIVSGSKGWYGRCARVSG